MKSYLITWETDGEDPEQLGLPETIQIRDGDDLYEVVDNLSDEYGWLIAGLEILTETVN